MVSIPTIHLNGTSRNELLQQLIKAAAATDAALDAVRNAAPHGRDYYVQGDEAFKKARDEHQARCTSLHNIANDLRLIAESII